ncbi:MAG: hypothetical protein P8M72_05415 [Gammaproteobacteria bacterium]|nr:hypothetical protein [Gammaproteobacteria bacterium]
MKAMIKKAGMATFLCCALPLQSTVLLASDYDEITGIINVSCLEGTINGTSIGLPCLLSILHPEIPICCKKIPGSRQN